MPTRTTPPIPPRPDLAPAEAAGAWAVLAPDRRGVVRRAMEIWRRTLPASVVLTVALQGIPALVQRLLTPRTTGTSIFTIWLHTGQLPRTYVAPPTPAPHPVVFPLSLLAAIVLLPLLYVALLRLMLGASIGAPLRAGLACSLGLKRLGQTIVVGICASLIISAIVIPFAIAFVAFVNGHAWKAGAVFLALGVALAEAVISMSIAALVGEQRTGWRATRRSWALAWRYPALGIGVLGSVVLVVAVVGLAANAVLPNVVQGDVGLLVQGLVVLVINALMVPLTGAFITSAYLELRARSEELSPATLDYTLRLGD